MRSTFALPCLLIGVPLAAIFGPPPAAWVFSHTLGPAAIWWFALWGYG